MFRSCSACHHKFAVACCMYGRLFSMRGRCLAGFLWWLIRTVSNCQMQLWDMNLLCGLRWLWLLPFLLGPEVRHVCTRLHEGSMAIPLQNPACPSTHGQPWSMPVEFNNSFFLCSQAFVPWSMTGLAFYIFGDLVLVVWALGSSVAVQIVLVQIKHWSWRFFYLQA